MCLSCLRGGSAVAVDLTRLSPVSRITYLCRWCVKIWGLRLILAYVPACVCVFQQVEANCITVLYAFLCFFQAQIVLCNILNLC